MDVSLTVSIDHIGFNMLSQREVELRFLMSFNAQVNQELESNMITDIEIEDIDPQLLEDIASITVYSVQKGDSLFSIAKRYNTTIQEIAELNEIENVNMIYPNQKLLIVKKVAGN